MQLLQRQLKQIEHSGQDDFTLLEEVGPNYFSTEELYYLKGQAAVKKALFEKIQSAILYLGLSIPVWIGLSFILGVSGLHTLARTSMMLTPITTLLFFTGLLFMHYFFKDRGHSENMESLIKKAINQRKKRNVQLN